MESAPGDCVERYQLKARLGRGGQGQVFLATDRSSGLDVALKVIPLTTGDESAAERLRREARRLAKLSHPALPTCHALVEDLRRGTIGVSLELIEGASLNELPGPLERHEQHALLSQVASALAYLHGKGLVHRDLAPRNIMLTRGFREDRWRPGCVKLVDLGLSIEQGNPRPLTSLGRIVGTAPYLPPERLVSDLDGPEPSRTTVSRNGREGSFASAADVFALGVIGWELRHGSHPTGLPPDAPIEAFARAYQDAVSWGAWPAAISTDPLELVLRRLLAPRVQDRPRDGAKALALLATLPWEPLSSRPSVRRSHRTEVTPSVVASTGAASHAGGAREGSRWAESSPRAAPLSSHVPVVPAAYAPADPKAPSVAGLARSPRVAHPGRLVERVERILGPSPITWGAIFLGSGLLFGLVLRLLFS